MLRTKIGLVEAWRTRGAWESRAGHLVRWAVYFVCLLAGLYAAVLFGPKVGVVVTLGALAFFAWWSSAFVGGRGETNCLLILLLIAVNLGCLMAYVEVLLRHKAA